MTLTAAPARHFSGRGIKRGGSLWASFILNIYGFTIYIGGDSGYDSHFKTIGDKYGPFDIAILECGQYNESWPYIHMFPEETVQASIDLKAKALLPVHWGKFTLAYHPWNEPVQRITKAAEGVIVTTPRIGEPVVINKHYPNEVWWDF
jgi:L-ascorbate metabolism protein UlaG (beta-lactamase superfamily)